MVMQGLVARRGVNEDYVVVGISIRETKDLSRVMSLRCYCDREARASGAFLRRCRPFPTGPFGYRSVLWRRRRRPVSGRATGFISVAAGEMEQTRFSWFPSLYLYIRDNIWPALFTITDISKHVLRSSPLRNPWTSLSHSIFRTVRRLGWLRIIERWLYAVMTVIVGRSGANGRK